MQAPVPMWAEAVLIVDFDESHGQVVQHVHPRDALPPRMVEDIKMISMPDCLEAGERHEFTFQARVRNKEGTAPFEALNIYVYFKQKKSCASRRGYEQRSIVLVCRHYYSDMCNRILSRFADVIEALPMYQQMLSGPDPVAAAAALDSAIEVCFQHFRQWPDPVPGKTMLLPFYGEMFEITVPDIAPYILSSSSSLGATSSSRRPGDMCLGEGSGVLGEINLMSVLGPLGLLPHLWTMWELVISGKDIVVYSPSAAICSAVVRALASLTVPLVCCADMRCYINNYDSDTNLFAAAADAKFAQAGPPGAADGAARAAPRTNSVVTDTQYTLLDSIHVGRDLLPQCIIGITNPFLLRTFSKFQNAIFIPSDDIVAAVEEASRPGPATTPVMSGLAKLGMGYLFGSPKGADPPDAVVPQSPPPPAPYSPPVPRPPPKLFRHAYGAAKAIVMNPPSSSLEAMYDQWCAAGGAGRSKAGKTTPSRRGASKKTHVLLVLRGAPTISADKSILNRMSQFSIAPSASVDWDGLSFGGSENFEDSDAVSVGGLLLREHFKMLTLTVLKPFDSFFSPVDYRGNTERMTRKVVREPSLSNSLSVRRVGAKLLWLYADTTTILGVADTREAIQTFLTFYQSGNFPPSLSVIGKAKLAALLSMISETQTFRIWVEWRRNSMVSQLCWSMVETSRDLSLGQLLAAFAVEQGKEFLLASDVATLIHRVENTIANVRAINSASSAPVADDGLLCGHMLKHLQELNSLVVQSDQAKQDVVYSASSSSDEKGFL